jgi:hypothetical protein
MCEVCTFVDYKERTFDYKRLSQEPLFQELIVCAGKLRRIELEALSNSDRIILFINAFNMMVIKGVIIRGCADTQEDRTKFLNSDLFFIGPYKFSPNDLRNLLLGRSGSIPEYKYYLRRFATSPVDPRIIFTLSDGCFRDPLPICVTKDRYDQILDDATSDFLTHDCIIDSDSRLITIHGLFSSYRDIIWKSMEGLLHFISRHVKTRHHKEDVRRLLEGNGNIMIDFRDRDYRSNRPIYFETKPNEEIRLSESNRRILSLTGVDHRVLEDQLRLVDVITNDCYRDYFKKFAKLEYSIENILFYEACKEYRQAPAKERRNLAINIYEKFLKPESEYEINVAEYAIITFYEQVFKKKSTGYRRKSFLMPKNTKDEDLVGTYHNQSAVNVDVTVPPIDDEELPIELIDELDSMVECALSDTFNRFLLSEIYRVMIDDVKQFLELNKNLVTNRNRGRGTLLLLRNSSPTTGSLLLTHSPKVSPRNSFDLLEINVSQIVTPVSLETTQLHERSPR